MKKLVLFFVLINLSVYCDSTEIFLEYNLNKKIEFSHDFSLEKEKKDLGFNMEFFSPPSKNIVGGFGFIHNKIELLNNETLNLTTYYLVNKYYLTNNKIKTFWKIQGGGYYPSTVFEKTSIDNPKKVVLDKGYFYGTSLGVEYKNYILESFYKGYIGDSTIDSEKSKFKYTTLTFSLGYSIGM